MIDETGKVIFEDAEQQEVNRIVEERLARERGKYSDYNDLQETISELHALGYEGTPAQVKAAVRAVREQNEAEAKLLEAQELAAIEGTSPAIVKKLKDLEDRAANLEREKAEKLAEMEIQEQNRQKFEADIAEFKENHEDVDLEKLNKDEDFIDFLENSSEKLSLSQVYDRYSKYVLGAEKKAAAKIQSNLDRSTSSGKQKGSNSTYGLSADQRAMVDDWNKSARSPKEKITYEEFSANLRR